MNEKENRHFEKQLAVTGLKKSELLRNLILRINIQPSRPKTLFRDTVLCST